MSAIHCDTPVWYTRSQAPRGYTIVGGTAVEIGPYGRAGSDAFRFTGDPDAYFECLCDGEFAKVPSGARWIQERDVRLSAYPASGQRKMLMACTDGATVQDGLYVEDDGTLSVCRGSGGGLAVLDTTTFVLPLNTDYRVGIDVLIHASAGTADVQAQGPGDLLPVNVLSTTGLDTLESGAAQWNRYRNGSASPGVSTCQNWFVKDGSGGINDALSTAPQNVVVDCRVIADTAQADSTPSAGLQRFANVDEVTADDDLTWNQFNNVNDEDIYAAQQVPDPNKPIAAVALVMVARNGGGAEELALTAIEGGTPFTGAAHALTGANRHYAEMLDESPSGNPWSPLVWANMQLGGDGIGAKRTT